MFIYSLDEFVYKRSRSLKIILFHFFNLHYVSIFELSKMLKLYICDVCGKSYKNSRSLSSHKYSYHTKKRRNSSPHTIPPSTDFDMMSESEFNLSPSTSNDLHSHHTVNGLEEKVFALEKESRTVKNVLENVKISVKGLENLAMLNSKTSDICTDAHFSQNKIIRLEDMIKSNKSEVLELKIQYSASVDDHVDSLAVEDLVDDLIEMSSLFANKELDKIVADIPNFRLIINFILKFMNLSKIGEPEIDLLKEISGSSKNPCKNLIKENFDKLVHIFETLDSEFDDLVYKKRKFTKMGSEVTHKNLGPS